MISIARGFLGVSLGCLLAVGVTSAAFAGNNDNSSAISDVQRQNPNDWRAAKAMSDDELAQVSAGVPAPMQGPNIGLNFVNVGGHVKVFNAAINGLSATKVRVKPSVKVWSFSVRNIKPVK